MGLWVQACESEAAPLEPCIDPVWVDVSAAIPFELTEAHFATMGEAFAAGVMIVTLFWGLGWVAGLIADAIKRH